MIMDDLIVVIIDFEVMKYFKEFLKAAEVVEELHQALLNLMPLLLQDIQNLN